MAEKQTIYQEYMGDELLPPEGHPDVGKFLWEMLDKILRDKIQLGLHEKWLYHYRLGRNKHWKNASRKLALVSPNLLYTHRQRTKSMLTAKNPTFNVRRIGPIDPGNEEKVNVLLHASEQWWIDNEIQGEFRKSVHNGETYGITVGYIPFDPDADAGDGAVAAYVVDPFMAGWYPTDSEYEKCSAMLYFRPMSVRDARREWPEFREKIKPDSEWMEELGRERREIGSDRMSQGTSFKSNINNVTYLINQIVRGGGTGLDDELLVVTGFVKDYSTVPIMQKRPLKDDQGRIATAAEDMEEPTDEVEYLYPGNIRYVVACNGGKVVMEDKRNPCVNWDLPIEKVSKTYLFSRFPFTVTPSITDPSNPWGCSDFEQGSPIQVELNRAMSQFNLWKNETFGKTKLINPQDSGVMNEQFTNVPGPINPSTTMRGSGIKWIEPPKSPIDMIAAINMYKDFFFLVLGTFELERAQAPGRDVIAFKALQALIEIAAVMSQEKEFNYSKMVREWGRMFVSHVQNWYIDPDRYYTTYKDVQGVEKTVPVYGPDLILPVKLTVVSGSTMPVSKIQEAEQAINLADKGHIDSEELLKKLDWSGREEVIRRMKEGPFTDLLSKLTQLGFPPGVIQLMTMLQKIDPRQFEQAMKSGQLPSFEQILSGQPPEEEGAEGQNPVADQARMIEAKASAAVKIAQAQLIEEKINTEKIVQEVKATGMKFDQEKLEIERARLVNDIEAKKQELASMAGKNSQGPYREKGAKSNNAETRE